ncbi:hypothetical protein EGW08_003122, partial [Elysia chlorotica]
MTTSLNSAVTSALCHGRIHVTVLVLLPLSLCRCQSIPGRSVVNSRWPAPRASSGCSSSRRPCWTTRSVWCGTQTSRLTHPPGSLCQTLPPARGARSAGRTRPRGGDCAAVSQGPRPPCCRESRL